MQVYEFGEFAKSLACEPKWRPGMNKTGVILEAEYDPHR
jgi:hypothetical protein